MKVNYQLIKNTLVEICCRYCARKAFDFTPNCSMVSQKYHTPFCDKNCRIEHHDLVTVLCLDSSQKSDELPDLLKECIDSYQNWDHNGEVPDPLESLRCPLIYLASAFGKAGLVKALLQDSFDARALNFNGETALHGAVQYIFRTGTLKARGLKVASTLGPIKNRMKAFGQILTSLTEKDPTIMFVQDNDGNTAFHAAADNIWNDRQNDRQGRSAVFFQFCLKSMIARALVLEGTGKVTREEILETLNAENSDGDTIFHILARDYAYGFRTMKHVLDKFFPGQVPFKVNKENETVANIALQRNRKRAVQVFPEFLEQSDSSISVSSDSETSESDSPSPSTSRESKQFSTPRHTTVHQEIPLIIISDTDMPQVPHTIEEGENSSSDVIANSKETMTGSVDQERITAPLSKNLRTHDLLTVSIDSTLGKASQMEVPSLLSLSQKSTVAVSPYDSFVNAPVDAEVMYVTNEDVVSRATTESNSSAEGGEQCDSSFKRLEVLDTANEVTANDQSDPISPFSITFSSSDSNASSANSSQEGSSGGAPPSDERVAMSSEECASRDSGKEDPTVTDSITESEVVQGNSSEAGTSVNDTVETCDTPVPHTDTVSLDTQTTQAPSQSQVTTFREGEREPAGNDVQIVPNQQPAFEVPQTNLSQSGKVVNCSPKAKATCESIPSDLFAPPRKQIPEPGEYAQLYAYHMIDTPGPASQYQSKVDYDKTEAHESTSLTSLASASTETIHSDTIDDSLDISSGGTDDRSTILKCITDNSFLEFLITEGLELDSSSKKGVVDVVLTQYSAKLSRVENTIPKLSAQIRQTETTIDRQTEKVTQLHKELEFVKGEIVKNKNLLEGFINEQQVLSKQRRALKRKVARCEGTMKQLLGNSKKSRFD